MAAMERNVGPLGCDTHEGGWMHRGAHSAGRTSANSCDCRKHCADRHQKTGPLTTQRDPKINSRGGETCPQPAPSFCAGLEFGWRGWCRGGEVT